MPKGTLPKNWKSFLQCSDNKSELFTYLAQTIQNQTIPPNKEVYCTSEDKVLCSHVATDADIQNISPCNHEEADSRIFVHLADAVDKGYRYTMIRANDTDIVVLAVSVFQKLNITELWIHFGTGKDSRYIAIHQIALSLGPQKSFALPMFHALTGCDFVSAFANKGKKTAWDTWLVCPAITGVLQELGSMPERVTDEQMTEIERFIVVMYSRGSQLNKVNEARLDGFTGRPPKQIENIPPTLAALKEHVKRAVLIGGHIWAQCLVKSMNIPNAEDWGWKRNGNIWKPYWTTLQEAMEGIKELISCGCKKSCTGRCKCFNAGFKCTAMCACNGTCNNQN